METLSSLIHSHVLIRMVISGVCHEHPHVQAEHPATTHTALALTGKLDSREVTWQRRCRQTQGHLR